MIRFVGRVIQAAWTLVMAAAVLVGLPWALIYFIGWPLPRTWPDPATLRDWIDHPFTPTRYWKAVAILAWVLWGTMIGYLVVDLLAQLDRVRPPRIRIRPLQGLAAGMVGATVATVSSATGHAALPAAVAPAPVPAVDPGEAGQAGPVYVVERGDWLSAVAGRFLGDPDAHPRLLALNPQLAARGPSHIEPGWRLNLPADATDRGIRLHAAGHINQPAAPAAPAPPPVATQTTPTVDATESHDGAANDEASDDSSESHIGALGGAGLLTTLLLRAVTAARRRSQPYYAPGAAQPTPRGGRTERRLLAAQRPTDVDRLDHALCDLAATLTDRGAAPDIFGVRVNGGDVHLLLTDPAAPVPAPWLDEGTQWVLPAYHELSTAEPSPVPPLPALATVGSRSGRHLMLDLERLGTLWIGGNPERAHELLTYLACELALSVWSEHVRVELAGFGDDVDLIAELNPDRVTIRRNPADAVAELRTLLAVDTATGPDPLDTLGVRLRGEPADPRVLLIARPDEHVRAELAALDRDLAQAGRRCGIAAVATLRTPPPGRATLILTDDGAVQLDLPWLRSSTDAAALPAAELEPLAEIMRFARLTTPPAQVATQAEWSATIDPVAAVPRLFDPTFAPEPEPPTPQPPDHLVPLSTPDDVAVEAEVRDPDLDDDLAAWHDPASSRPKVAILGQVNLTSPLDHASDPAEVNRHRRHRRLADELAVYLLSRPDASARREPIEDALWSGEPVNPTTSRGVVTGLRARLGTRADGTPWLSDTGGRPGTPYQLHPGVLFDWQLFTRLRDRAAHRGGAPAGADLHAALRLVRGVPFDDAKDSTGHRQTYTWLPESPIGPGRIVPAITDVAHRLAQHHLARGDTAAVRWTVNQAWLADPYRGTDELWLDLMHAEKADHHSAVLHNLLDELLKAREVEVPEELPHPTYQALRELLPDRA